jgi:flagella basal body P-ring formation protein FlgA
MIRFASFLALSAASLLALASPAMAAQSVELRGDVVLHDGKVTLGDLFDDSGAAGSVVVASGAGPGETLVLNAARVQATAQSYGLVWSNSRGLTRIIVRSEASASSAQRPRAAEVLVYARDFRAGEIVQPQDLAWSKAADLQVPLDAPHDARSIIGLAAKRPLREGSAASARDVGAAEVIKKDDVVAVAYEVGGVKLVLQAKALGPAAAGETVQVVNPTSKKVIQAVATGPGEAVVGPEAERLKAAGSNSQLIASLR